MEIDFSFENPSYVFELNETKTEDWIKRIIESEGKKTGIISYFFCSDEYLLDINQRYLKHDDYTDIITFDYVEDDTISGDILISLDRVKENAKKFGVAYRSELFRVMSHGILHLLGYKDKTQGEQAKMREKEEYCLTLQPSN